MIEISATLRSTAALETLIVEANKSPFIGEIELGELQALIRVDTLRFIYSDDILAGFGGWMSVNAEWVEVGPFYVAEQFRGLGLGKAVIHLVVAQSQVGSRNLYAVTRNPAVKHLLNADGFQEISFVKLPLPLQAFAVRKLSLRKIIRLLQKSHPEPIAQLIRLST